VIAESLTLAAWTMTWRAALGLSGERWSRIAVLVLTFLCIVGQTLSLSMLAGIVPHGIAVVSSYVLSAARTGFALLLIYVFGRGIVSTERDRWLALLGLVISAIGLFAPELGLIGVPGIWFPFGVGVSRTEYAYIALDIVVFALLLCRLWRHAPAAAR
jgi:hypothetical protein